jgi:hypothetical protein
MVRNKSLTPSPLERYVIYGRPLGIVNFSNQILISKIYVQRQELYKKILVPIFNAIFKLRNPQIPKTKIQQICIIIKINHPFQVKNFSAAFPFNDFSRKMFIKSLF